MVYPPLLFASHYPLTYREQLCVAMIDGNGDIFDYYSQEDTNTPTLKIHMYIMVTVLAPLSLLYNRENENWLSNLINHDHIIIIISRQDKK